METKKYDTTHDLLADIRRTHPQTLGDLFTRLNEIAVNLETALGELRFAYDRHSVQHELQNLEKSVQWINSNIYGIRSKTEDIVEFLMEQCGEPKRAFRLELNIDSFKDPERISYRLTNLSYKRMEFKTHSKFRSPYASSFPSAWLMMREEDIKKQMR